MSDNYEEIFYQKEDGSVHMSYGKLPKKAVELTQDEYFQKLSEMQDILG